MVDNLINQKITLEVIQLINLFEKITRAKVKDCFTREDQVIFVIQSGDLAKALGKNSSNIIKLKELTRKQIKVIEFSDDPIRFVRSIVKPAVPESINLNNNTVEIKADSTKTKGLLIGRDSKNLQMLRTILKKYFPYDVQIL